ncbi:MAG: hypothetical protein A2231_11930 [Candidatus Firestonebacteria bacterium RIFOXYA2_FULL_40_8]|nr:MAG: hypothetical protein A2231_11930 [Candidatus Firestonebacteria bacterium RIFOXYA2_FULL_40_8]
MFNLIANTYSWATSKVKDMTGVLGGNAKVVISTQLFFSVPVVWFSTYWSLYLVELGAGKEYIGYLASVLVAVQVLVSFFSVFLVERFGHKRTYIIVSFICWPLSMLVYAFTGNIFVASGAIIINSMFMLGDPSFVFLYLKGVKKKSTHSGFSVLNILFTAASFFSPIAGIFINKLGIIDGGRIVFIIGAILMSLAVAIRTFLIEDVESKRTKDGVYASFIKYKSVFMSFISNSYLLKIILIDTLMVFNLTVINTFSAIYLTDKSTVALDSSLISYFPAIYAAFNIILSLFVVPKIKLRETRKYLQLSMIAGILAWVILLLAQKGNFWVVTVSYALHGFWFAMYFPLIMGILVNSLKKDSKTISFSIINVITLSASVPAGAIAGRMYILNPKLPFIMVTIVYIITLLLLGKFLQAKNKG